jgi:hypothetical protein
MSSSQPERLLFNIYILGTKNGGSYIFYNLYGMHPVVCHLRKIQFGTVAQIIKKKSMQRCHQQRMKTNVDIAVSILFLFHYLLCDCPKLYLFLQSVYKLTSQHKASTMPNIGCVDVEILQHYTHEKNGR